MGALHDGHLSLIRRARQACELVVVSLFVNPMQFNEPTDLEGYPRQQERDSRLAHEAGADILFAPTLEEVYPAGFATSVEVLGITDRLEGAVRGNGHFRGVTTVVTKLLNMTLPDVAFFGQKDAQQVVVIKRLVEDLNLPVQIETCPTVRETGGLAMSSRNAHLSPDERAQALALFCALEAARELAGNGERRSERLLAGARGAMAPFGLEPEYLALVDPETLEDLAELTAPALLAIAARVGATRLIDNVRLEPAVPPADLSQANRSPQLQADPLPHREHPGEARQKAALIAQ
jgi:pantoate--beta-alanine ligase